MPGKLAAMQARMKQTVGKAYQAEVEELKLR